MTDANRGFQVVLPTQAALRLRARSRDLLAVLRSAATTSPSSEDAALRARLMPNPYPDDNEAAEEFARLSGSEVADGKRSRAAGLIAAVERALEDAGCKLSTVEALAPTELGAPWPPSRTPIPEQLIFELHEGDALDWVRAVTDLRLALAHRLGIVDQDTADRIESADLPEHLRPMRDDYIFFATFQEGLVSALSQPVPGDDSAPGGSSDPDFPNF